MKKLNYWLVAWFGVYQIGHILSNIRGTYVLGVLGRAPFPAMPGPGGWSDDLFAVFVVMAILDSSNAIASLFFIRAYLKGNKSLNWLGTSILWNDSRERHA